MPQPAHALPSQEHSARAAGRNTRWYKRSMSGDTQALLPAAPGAVQVVPKAGGSVKVLLGRHRGEVATVVEVLKEDFVARLELRSGQQVLQEYEYFSKYVD